MGSEINLLEYPVTEREREADRQTDRERERESTISLSMIKFLNFTLKRSHL